MRMNIYRLLLIPVLAAGAIATGCKKWDDHNAITDASLTKTIFEQISADTSLSRFADLLKKTGYDQVIASSKTFTVFAPTNTALAGLDAAIVNDAARLKLFVGNHIANQSYFTRAIATSLRIPMLNGKYHNLLASTVNDATITQADRPAKNGVYHVINKMLPALSNCWETLEKDPAIPASQKEYMLSLFMNVFDTTNAVQTGVNPATGEPIYQPGTDSVYTNVFWRSVYDLRDESRQYTLFVLTDAAWDAEIVKFSPWLKVPDSLGGSAPTTKWHVLKDLAAEGLYPQTTVADTLLSKFDVKIPVDKLAIVQTITTSNGIIYIMNKVDIQPRHKIKPIIIQGESYRAMSAEKRGNTYFRDRFNSITGTEFRDVLVYGHGTSTFNLSYRLSDVYSTKYNVSWVALNDFQTATFTQKITFNDPASTGLGYKTVSVNNFNEITIGEVEFPNFSSVVDMFLVATNTTTAATNPLVCDYIKLDPVF